MTSRKKSPQTYRELAAEIGVSIRTVEKWRDYPDWPKRRDGGTFDMRLIRAFLKRHQLGEHNPNRNGKAKAHNSAYVDARVSYLGERTERERIAREMAEIEYAKALGQLLLLDDVRKIFARTIGIATTTLRYLPDAVDAALPVDLADGPRERVLNIVRRVQDDIFKTMETLTTEPDDAN
jgi:hypothetical protein